MRIAYLAQIDASRESGISKKVRDQLLAWQAGGHDVALFAMTRESECWDGWGNLSVVIRSHQAGMSRFSAAKAITRQVMDWLPDVVYYRMGVCYPAFLRLASSIPLFLECNSDDIAEVKRYLGPVELVYYRLIRRAVLNRSRGMVAVAAEVARKVAAYTKPILVLGNGISLETHPALPPTANAQPRLIFIGSGNAEWYGLDAVLEMANRFPAWDFDIVGQIVPSGSQSPDNVTYHGHLPGHEYIRILASADIAIGSLALHRINLSEASPLKTREYLARGLPTIIGYRDTDFPFQAPFLLELPNAEGSVSENLSRIEEFVWQWKGRRVPRDQIGHLDVHEKEIQRLEFLGRVTSQ